MSVEALVTTDDGRPSPTDIELYLGFQTETAIIEGERAAQDATCRTDPYTADLKLALLRRIACSHARKSTPLGMQVGVGSVALVGTYDPEVRRLERPYRRLVVG